jgi:hypothetical protein
MPSVVRKTPFWEISTGPLDTNAGQTNQLSDRRGQIQSKTQRAPNLDLGLPREHSELAFQANRRNRSESLHIGYGNCVEKSELRNRHFVWAVPVLRRQRNVVLNCIYTFLY